MAKIFYEQDCNISMLNGKTVAVIGYGSQGHAHALNMKESGVNVIIGLYEGSKSWAKAEKQGLTVYTAAAPFSMAMGMKRCGRRTPVVTCREKVDVILRISKQRRTDLLLLTGAVDRFGPVTRLAQRRHQHRRQYGNNGNNDQQFYESKGGEIGGQRKLSFHEKRRFSLSPKPPFTFKEKRRILAGGPAVWLRTHPYKKLLREQKNSCFFAETRDDFFHNFHLLEKKVIKF